MSKPKIPTTMRALQIRAYNEDLNTVIKSIEVVEKPVPKPGPGQVLVKIDAAACNPSDLTFLRGMYNIVKTLPAVPGFEGAGTVVASGGGLIGRMRLGKRVACGGQADSDGTWAEYFVTEARSCLPIDKKLSGEQGAFMIVNPLTAAGLFHKVTSRKSKAFIQTAAASQLGRMLVKLGQMQGVESINIVRRKEQVDILKALGAKHILNSSEPGFEGELQELATELKATTGLDAISGDMTGTVLNAMPDHSEVQVYGTLGGTELSNITSRGLSYRGKTLSGFNLKRWAEGQGVINMLRTYNRMQKYFVNGELKTDIVSRIKFEDAVEGLAHYANNMTEGKVVILP